MAIELKKGFTLVECLIAMCLFSVMLILCEGMFVIQQKTTLTVLHDIDRLNTIRQLYLRLEPLIARAGFLGMQTLSSALPIVIKSEVPYSNMPHTALIIHKAQGKSWNPPLPAVLSHKVATGTDVIILEYANTFSSVKSGWFVIADGYQAEIFFSEGYPSKKAGFEDHAVMGSWQIIAVYMQKGEEGFELMQKSLLPMSDAVNILTGLDSFHCEQEGALVKVTVSDNKEPISVWFGQG